MFGNLHLAQGVLPSLRYKRSYGIVMAVNKSVYFITDTIYPKTDHRWTWSTLVLKPPFHNYLCPLEAMIHFIHCVYNGSGIAILTKCSHLLTGQSSSSIIRYRTLFRPKTIFHSKEVSIPFLWILSKIDCSAWILLLMVVGFFLYPGYT